MKRYVSFITAILVLLSVILIPSAAAEDVPEAPSLKETSVLRTVSGNPYLQGICGTVTAERLAEEFEGKVTFTSTSGEVLAGDTFVPSDTVISLGDKSVLALIYGDCDRNGKITLGDVSAMLKYFAKWDTPVCSAAADVDGDYAKNLTDASILMKFIAKWEGVSIGPDVTPYQITLSYYDSECTSVGVTWHTKDGSMTPVIAIKKDLTEEEIDDGLETDTEMYRATNLSGVGDRICRAVVDKLDFGTSYLYRVGDTSGTWSEWIPFTMREESDEEFTIFAFTDTQSHDGGSSAGNNWRSAWRAGMASYPDTGLAIHAGDVVENIGFSDWGYMLDTSAEFVRSIPTMVVSGNHETSYAGTSGYRMQYHHFYTDMPEQASVDSGYFYSFDYQSVHFVMLNTNKQGTDDDSLSDEQIAWLRADLAANDATWTVAVMHHPMYSPGPYGADPEKNAMSLTLREQLSSVFAEGGVDLVIAGHDHVHYSTYPITSDGTALTDAPTEKVGATTYFTSPEGVIYTSPGCTGANVRSFYNGYDESLFRFAKDSVTTSFMVLHVSSDSLRVDFGIPVSGEFGMYDSFGIKK